MRGKVAMGMIGAAIFILCRESSHNLFYCIPFARDCLTRRILCMKLHDHWPPHSTDSCKSVDSKRLEIPSDLTPKDQKAAAIWSVFPYSQKPHPITSWVGFRPLWLFGKNLSQQKSRLNHRARYSSLNPFHDMDELTVLDVSIQMSCGWGCASTLPSFHWEGHFAGCTNK